MIEITKKYYKLILIISLSILSFLYMNINKKDNMQSTIVISNEDEKSLDTITDDEVVSVDTDDIGYEKVPVYVCGEVYKPDVYHMYETDIIKDAILLAGGFTNDADLSSLNLAMEIRKGIKIYVPKIGEEIDKSDNSYDNSIEEIYNQDTEKELIDINTADIAKLTTLNGIGPTIGQNIITYREENGDFKSIEDIKNVSRIGEVTFEKIKDYIYCK